MFAPAIVMSGNGNAASGSEIAAENVTTVPNFAYVSIIVLQCLNNISPSGVSETPLLLLFKLPCYSKRRSLTVNY